MRADSFDAVERAARWLQLDIPDATRERLVRYGEWLGSEAIVAGGLGPNESKRLWSRHVADSLLFGVGLERSGSVADLGTGVGLPGIPLAIMYPDCRFDLVDRSGRRCDLLKRAIAVLGLDNCHVIHRDLSDVDKRYDSLVSRASLPPERLMIHVKRLLNPLGTTVVGLSRSQGEQPELELPSGWHMSVIAVPPDILDTPVHLLRIVAA